MTVTIGRRELLAALGGAAVAWPLAAHAQQGERMRRVGVPMESTDSDAHIQARRGIPTRAWQAGMVRGTSLPGKPVDQ